MPLCVRTSDGEAVEVVARLRLTDANVRSMMIKEMLVMRARGFTDEEIGLKYRYRRETVNRMINSVPEDVKERLREVGLV